MGLPKKLSMKLATTYDPSCWIGILEGFGTKTIMMITAVSCPSHSPLHFPYLMAKKLCSLVCFLDIPSLLLFGGFTRKENIKRCMEAIVTLWLYCKIALNLKSFTQCKKSRLLNSEPVSKALKIKQFGHSRSSLRKRKHLKHPIKSTKDIFKLNYI